MRADAAPGSRIDRTITKLTRLDAGTGPAGWARAAADAVECAIVTRAVVLAEAAGAAANPVPINKAADASTANERDALMMFFLGRGTSQRRRLDHSGRNSP